MGGFGWKYDAVVEAVRELDLRDWVRFVGYAGMQDLPALYQMAQAVVFPSLDEGFGLPLLEAFAAGTPVVASNAGAIPEVGGDAALALPPEDDEALALNLLRLLTDAGLRERQVAAGRARAGLYSWSASAAAHRAVYELIAAADNATASEDAPGFARGRFPAEFRAPRAARRNQAPLQRRVAGQLEHRLAPGTWVVRAEENAGCPNHLWECSGGRGDDGGAATHRLDGGKAEAFEARRQRQGDGAGVEGRQVLGRDVGQHGDPIAAAS